MPEPEECIELHDVVGSPLLCYLPEGHDGLHYDSAEKISWKVGEPNA
jgi:hypothetical protein